MSMTWAAPAKQASPAPSPQATDPRPTRSARARAERLVHALAARLDADVVETHISWVLLAGADAWKIKKPVRLHFVDYTALGDRLRCCEEEVRLNARLAPGIYLGVMPIKGTFATPELAGTGAAIEYAVHMRRFREQDLFSRRLAAGCLVPGEVDELTDRLAAFHRAAPVARADGPFGTAERRQRAAAACLDGLAAVATAGEMHTLRQWMAQEAQRLAPAWAERLAGGHVREGHGDLHLANIVRMPDGVAAFDGIEFDEGLRWIDVIDDAAFATMDFAAHGRRDLAFRFLNRWLDGTGEHEGLPLVRHALVYRALVRAQVALLHHNHGQPTARNYVNAALAWTRRPPPHLTVMHGLPGSGKTTVSQALLEAEGAIRIRSDVERKRLFGVDGAAAPEAGLYGERASRLTYERLFRLARLGLDSGFPVILDAAFLRRADREAARQLATACGAQFVIARCHAPYAVMRERLRLRHGDASDATPGVLDRLVGEGEPLGEWEAPYCQTHVTG